MHILKKFSLRLGKKRSRPGGSPKSIGNDEHSGKALYFLFIFFKEFFLGVKLAFPGTWFRAQNQSRTEDVTEYFKGGEASPEGFLKSVLTFQDVVATGRWI